MAGRPTGTGQPSAALDRIIMQCGSASALARRLGVTRQTIRHWQRRGIPVERLGALVAVADGSVSRRDLRPDIY